MVRIYFFALLFITVKTNQSIAQCTGPVPEPPAACTGTLLTDGTSVNTGQEYYYDGSAVTFSNVNVNGGTLRVCGDLNILNLNFNAGNIIVEPSGVFSFGQNIATWLNVNQLITNYGVLNVNQNYNLNSGSYLINFGVVNLNTPTSAIGGLIVNNSQGEINMNGNDLTLSTVLINKGKVSFRNLNINSGGGICMASGSTVAVENLTNNPTNSITVETGTACLSYSGQALLNGVLTASSNLFVCRLAGSQDPSPAANIGAAQVVNPCTSCEIVLPVDLISFSASLNGLQCELQWTTASEDNVRSFVIESGTDGQHFLPTGQVYANNRPSTYNFSVTLLSKTFFRLKMIDIDGRYTYSNVITADPSISSLKISVVPNPTTTGQAELRISSPEKQDGDICLMDMTGKLLSKKHIQLQRGIIHTAIPVNHLSPGIYQVYFKSNKSLVKTKLIIARD